MTLALEHQLEQLATDIARLRRRAEPDSSLHHLADRMAAAVETVDAIIQPSAHDLYALYVNETGNEHVAVNRALAETDARARRLHSLLGEGAR